MKLWRDKYLAYLAAAIHRRCGATKAHVDAHRPHFANNRDVAGFSAAMKEMIFTLGVAHAEGAHFTDLNGNKYLDVSMGFGVHLFGHRAPFLEAAMREQLEKGLALGPLYAHTGEVAQLIRELTGVERCAFYSTGTEAVMVAMRLARAVTRRNKIIIFEGAYHGTHDSLLAMKTNPATHTAIASVPGIPQEWLNHTIILKYGDAAAVELINARAADIAAVLVEPVMSRHPLLTSREFLQQLRQVCSQTGTALIFDEVITGFRMANGGMAEVLGIEPDIVTYGKVLGGGLPIGVVAGKATYLDAIDGGQWRFGDASAPQTKTTFTAGTFKHHPLAMATAKATLTLMKQEGAEIHRSLAAKTSHLCCELNNFFRAEGFSLSMELYGSLFRFKLSGPHKLLYYALFKEGIYVWEGRNCFLSTAHTDMDVSFFIETVKKCCYELAACGMLPGSSTTAWQYQGQYLQTALEINTVVEKAAFELACRYLFNTLPLLKKAATCTLNFQDMDGGAQPQFTVPGGTEARFAVTLFSSTEGAIIHVAAAKPLCDGWSMILFFRALSATYTALMQAIPFPPVQPIETEGEPFWLHRSGSQRGATLQPAHTLHAKIQFQEPPAPKGRLFSWLLVHFHSVLQELNWPVDAGIAIPMAGQLLTRKLKAFGNMTVHFPCAFPETVFTGTTDLEERMTCVERQLTGAKQQFDELYQSVHTCPVVFNLDNLDFELNFDGAAARLLTVDDTETAYPLVCNISRLKGALLVSVKYATPTVDAGAAESLLQIFCNRIGGTAPETAVPFTQQHNTCDHR